MATEFGVSFALGASLLGKLRTEVYRYWGKHSKRRLEFEVDTLYECVWSTEWQIAVIHGHETAWSVAVVGVGTLLFNLASHLEKCF